MRRTAVYLSPLFLAHDTGRGHVESADRLRGVYEELKRAEVAEHLLFPDFAKAALSAIQLNHTKNYVAEVAATANHAAYFLDADTRTSADSHQAALLAAGAVIDGLKRLDRGDIDNGFCLVRPPGHHAERDQAMGFCLFNSIAIGARWAKKHLGVERILILDWDLHHGNGTQHSFYRDNSVVYCSLHQYPHYPGSGALPETGEGKGRGYTINVPLSGGRGDLEYARLFNELIVPVTRSYRPDLILISCGFDCMAGDPLGAMRLTPAGVAYMTRVMVQLAGELCAGKILFSLEGGYDLENMRSGTLAVLSELCGSPLAADHPDFLSTEAAQRMQNSTATSEEIEQALNWIAAAWPMGT